MSVSINPRLLYLFDAIRNLPVPEADLDPDLITLGLEAGVIRRIIPLDASGVVTVWLTGTGVETALAMRSEGQLLLNLDITRHGLRLSRDLTAEEWSTTLSRIRVVKEAYHTALADLLNYGRAQFGSEFVEEKITQLAFPFDDINHAVSIGCTHLSLREKWRLSSEHYYILGLKFPTDSVSQELWAQRSSEHKLTPSSPRLKTWSIPPSKSATPFQLNHVCHSRFHPSITRPLSSRLSLRPHHRQPRFQKAFRVGQEADAPLLQAKAHPHASHLPSRLGL
jgi:hypothetical protein